MMKYKKWALCLGEKSHMKIKQVNLIYFSATGTTEKIVKAVCEGTGVPAAVYDFTFFNRQRVKTPPAFGADELTIVGIPVYNGRVPIFTRQYLLSLHGNCTPLVLLCVYGNRAYDDTLAEMYDLLSGQGFIPVAAGAFVGEHSFSQNIAYGRPNAKDLEEALSFGNAVREKIESEDMPAPLTAENIPGNRPYRDRGAAGLLAPTVGGACTHCGLCAGICPMGAINPADITEIDASKCILCRACAKSCPCGAIEFTQPQFQKIIKSCEDAFGKPDRHNIQIL